MLMIGKCGKVPMVGSIIPTNEKISFRRLPVVGEMPLVLIIKLASKEHDFKVEPVFPSPEFENLEIQNDG